LNKILKKYKTILWQLTFAWFFILMLNITLKYIPFDSNTAFLQIKQTEVNGIKPYLFIFYIHVYSAIFSLLAGFTQFNSKLLKNYPVIHKTIGKLYVFAVLFLAAPSGFFIGLFANGGFYSKVSFLTLSLLWFYFTLKGFLMVKSKIINLHKKFMLRSFALAFSAITLRLWKVILVYLFQPSPMDLYQIVSWLGWIPNLLLIELYIFKQKNK
jgi:hypothetical protein